MKFSGVVIALLLITVFCGCQKGTGVSTPDFYCETESERTVVTGTGEQTEKTEERQEENGLKRYELSFEQIGDCYGVKGITGYSDGTITVPDFYNGKKVTVILENAFNFITVSQIIIGESVERIERDAFNGSVVKSAVFKDESGWQETDGDTVMNYPDTVVKNAEFMGKRLSQSNLFIKVK